MSVSRSIGRRPARRDLVPTPRGNALPDAPRHRNRSQASPIEGTTIRATTRLEGGSHVKDYTDAADRVAGPSEWIPAPLFRMILEKYEQMVKSGTLTENDRVELINGYLVKKIGSSTSSAARSKSTPSPGTLVTSYATTLHRARASRSSSMAFRSARSRLPAFLNE